MDQAYRRLPLTFESLAAAFASTYSSCLLNENFLFIENINKNRASPVYNLTGGRIYILQRPGPLQTHYDGGNEYSVVFESHLENVDWTPKKRNGQLSQLELLLSQIVSIQVNFPLDSLSNIVLMKFHQVKLFF